MKPGSNAEVVRRYYEAFNEGGPELADRFIAEDFVADASRRLIEPTVIEGRANALREALRIYRTWGELVVEPEEVIPIGEDQVVAVVRNRARGAASDAVVESVTAQAWTVRDGKLTRFEYFGTREEALEATRPSDR